MSDADRMWRERGLREAVLAGDQDAWRRWYDMSFSALDGYVLWRCGGLRDLADDVLQETWMTAVRRIRQFDPMRASFASWLCGIAANVVRNQLRRRGIRAVASLNGDISGRRDESAVRDLGQRIAEALASLSERSEQVLRKKYLEGCSVGEIAAEWGDTEKAIESLLSRARTAFREAYSPEEGHHE